MFIRSLRSLRSFICCIRSFIHCVHSFVAYVHKFIRWFFRCIIFLVVKLPASNILTCNIYLLVLEIFTDGYVIDAPTLGAPASKAGSVVMGGSRAPSRMHLGSTAGGEQYASQPLYVVDNGRQRAASSDYALQSQRAPYGSEMQLQRGESTAGSVFRSRHDSF